MSAEENRQVARRFMEEFFNRKNVGFIDEIGAPDVVEHDSSLPEPIRGREALKQYWTSWLTAFPDLHLTIEDEIAEGDMVVQRVTVRGTHTGPLMSPGGPIPPTGKGAEWTAVHIARIVNGRLVEGWGMADVMGLMQQLGLIPPPQQAQ